MRDDMIEKLVRAENTPFYVFDLKEAARRVREIKSFLPDRVQLCYAVKANTFIIKTIASLVDHLEICSPGEYRICEKLGVPMEKYVISGVSKDPAFIDSIIDEDHPIGCYTAESVNQMELLRRIAGEKKRQISVLPRLTSGNQFGIDKEELFALLRNCRKDPLIRIEGIQYFSGTQKTSLKKLKRELAYLDQTIAELRDQLGFTVEKLEFGPGFPVSYFEGDAFDEREFMKGFSELLESMQYRGPVVLEIGRSLAASCGTYLTSVADIKQNRSERYAIVDGGMHQIVYYGQSMAMKHPKMRLYSKRAGSELFPWNICGSLCTTGDFLVKHSPLPDLRIGDVLIFEKAGAYCMTEGISLFLSRELPGIVLLNEDGSFRTVRKKIPVDAFNTPEGI